MYQETIEEALIRQLAATKDGRDVRIEHVRGHFRAWASYGTCGTGPTLAIALLSLRSALDMSSSATKTVAVPDEPEPAVA